MIASIIDYVPLIIESDVKLNDIQKRTNLGSGKGSGSLRPKPAGEPSASS